MQGLDEMNSGGWLRDSIILVRGPSGSGKTTLAGMYARAGASRGERVIYYGFEEPHPVLQRNFASLGLSMQELEAEGHLRFVCRYPEATSPEVSRSCSHSRVVMSPRPYSPATSVGAPSWHTERKE